MNVLNKEKQITVIGVLAEWKTSKLRLPCTLPITIS
jgi:hypothetical protein